MAIRVGGAGGGPIGNSRKGHALPLAPPKVPKPFAPVGETPWPLKQELRLGLYTVTEEKDDYLICEGFDPNAKEPDPGSRLYAPSAHGKIKVAKPTLLQRTKWDGETVTIAGLDYTYAYSDDDIGVRTVTWTDAEAVDQEEEQTIDIPYFVDDLIVAVELRENPAVDGIDVKSEAGGRLSWMDLNVSGRHWQGPGGADCTAQNCILQIAVLGSPSAGTFDMDLTVNSTDETLTFNWNDGSTSVTTELETHSEIAVGDVAVSRGPFPDATMRIEFKENLANTPIGLPDFDWSGLTGGVGVIPSFAQQGFA